MKSFPQNYLIMLKKEAYIILMLKNRWINSNWKEY